MLAPSIGAGSPASTTTGTSTSSSISSPRDRASSSPSAWTVSARPPSSSSPPSFEAISIPPSIPRPRGRDSRSARRLARFLRLVDCRWTADAVCSRTGSPLVPAPSAQFVDDRAPPPALAGGEPIATREKRHAWPSMFRGRDGRRRARPAEPAMIQGLVAFALHQRFITLALALLLTAGGIVSFYRLPIEAYPDVVDVEGDLWLRVKLPVGIALEATRPYVHEIRERIGTF